MTSFTTVKPLLKTMNDCEITSLEFLEKNYSHLVPNFLEMFSKGRKGILQRFAASLLREDVFGLFSDSSDLQKIGSVALLNVKELNSHWNAVMRKLQEGHLKEAVTYKMYTLAEGTCLAFPVSTIYGFRRVEIQEEILYIEESNVKAVESAAELMDILEVYIKEARDCSWENLKSELENGSANLALAYTFYEHDAKEQKKEAHALGTYTALDYAAAKKTGDFSPSLFFEQLSVEGHNLHPGAKTKLDMKPEDIVRYAPEFRGIFSLQFAAIHKDYAQWAEMEEQPIMKAYPLLKEAAEQQLQALQLNMDDYVMVPVHPWQMKYEIESIYKEEIAQNIVVPIRSFSVPCQATSSFRTVMPCKANDPFLFKAAVNSQMTSTVRSISAHTAMNAVTFTQMIRNVLKQTSLNGTFIPVCETAGYHFKSTNPMKSRNLTAVLRENADRFIEGEELAIVGSSLYALSPITNKPILAELVEKYAETTREPSLSRAGISFLRDYAELILPGFLILMVKYGIGLEGHLQNSIPVFENGIPKRFLFRDWGGARIYGERLQKHYGSVDFYPGSVTVTDSVDEMHNKVYYTVFQNHLGEIIFQLCKLYRIQEKACWKEVRIICDRLFQQLEAEAPKEWVDLDRTKLYQPLTDHKALTLMRMMPKQGYHYASVPNPLHAAGEEKKGRK